MNVVHEILEQIEDEANGKSFAWVEAFMVSIGDKHPTKTLHGMRRAERIILCGNDGDRVPEWQCEEWFRNNSIPDDIRIHAVRS